MPNRSTFLLLLFVCAMTSFAWAEPAPRTIAVTGTSVTRVPPDIAVWRLTVSELDTDLSLAVQQSQAKMHAILELLDGLAIPKEDIESGMLQIDKQYDRDRYGNQSVFKGYKVMRTLAVKLRNLEKFDTLLEKLAGTADAEISLSTESSKIHNYRRENRLEAVRLAREKAEAMAEAMGAKLGRVLNIEEHPQTGSPHLSYGGSPWFVSNSVQNAGAPGAGAATLAEEQVAGTFAPGAIEERCTVYLTFELE